MDRDGDLLRLVATPALVLGVAAGDTVRVQADGKLRVVARGGNLAIQLYGEHGWAGDFVDGSLRDVARIDARAPGLTVVTIPVEVGFQTVERELARWIDKHPTAQWFYGNVYDDDGTTPLNWWSGA